MTRLSSDKAVSVSAVVLLEDNTVVQLSADGSETVEYQVLRVLVGKLSNGVGLISRIAVEGASDIYCWSG